MNYFRNCDDVIMINFPDSSYLLRKQLPNEPFPHSQDSSFQSLLCFVMSLIQLCGPFDPTGDTSKFLMVVEHRFSHEKDVTRIILRTRFSK